MVKILSFFLLILSFQVSALQITSIDLPQTQSEEPLLLMNDGSVLIVQSEGKEDLQPFFEAQEKGLNLKIETNDKRHVLGVEVLRTPVLPEVNEFTNASYEPTVLPNEEDAKTIFNSHRKGARNLSQCFNRAHIWARESHHYHNLNSMKVFLFFTRKYIREYNHGWWFHVSPFTYVSQKSPGNERVLDSFFTRMPTPMKNWTDLFMRNGVECPVITKYSDYENNQEKAYCYLYKTSMYQLQPADLANEERTGIVKSEWLSGEVKRAYRNGFGMWKTRSR